MMNGDGECLTVMEVIGGDGKVVVKWW